MKKWVSALLVAAMCLSLCACGTKSTYAETGAAISYGKVSESGDAVFPAPDGTVETITGEVKYARKTEDRKHTVILEEDGTLSVLSEGSRTVIAEDVEGFTSLTNDAFLFTQKKEVDAPEAPAATEAYGAPAAAGSSSGKSKDTVSTSVGSRYVFASGEVYTMPASTVDSRLSTAGGTLLYSAAVKNTDKSALYLIKAEETEPTAVFTSTKQVRAAGTNHDGSVYAWAEGDKEGSTVYLCINGEKQKAFSADTLSSTYSLRFNKKEDFAILTGYDSPSIALWTASGGIVKAKLPNAVSETVCTSRGDISMYAETEAGTVYVQTQEDGTSRNLYAIASDGMREKIASSITNMDIRFGNLYYIKDDGTLFAAKLSGSTLSEERKIADDVCDFSVSPDGTAIVYARDVASDNVGAIYYYADGMDRPVRLTSEGYCMAYYFSYAKYWLYYLPAVFSNDGKTIFYFTDSSEIEDSGKYTATLMQYNIAKGDTVRIGSDILTYIGSNYIGGYPESNRLWYYKYTSYDEEEKDVLCDLMYWNGEAASVLVNDIIY